MRIRVPSRAGGPRILMKKIDSYVLTEVIGPFLGGVAFLSFIFLMFQALRLADEFIRRGAPWALVAKLTGLLVLSVLPFVLPLAFLLGVLVAFGRLSADS